LTLEKAFEPRISGLTRIGTKQFGPTENPELIRYANTGAFFKRYSQASLPMLLQNASPLGKPIAILHFHFLYSNHLAQGAKSRVIRAADERCVFTIPCKLACEGI
jgi:hypothetical protein